MIGSFLFQLNSNCCSISFNSASFTVPHFDYCSQTWHFCNKGSAKKKDEVNERAIRFVFRDKNTTYEERLELLDRRTLI